MRRLALAVAAVAALIVLNAAHAADVAATNPWARATPTGAKVGGAYLTLQNSGSSADRLVSATADVADHVEIHEMSMDNGVMKMRQMPNGIEIPPGGSVELKPGGYHLMLMGLKQPLKAGETIKGTVTFEKAGSKPVEFKVETMGATSAPMEHKH